MTTLLTIASVPGAKTPSAISVVQPDEEPVVEAAVPPTECPAEPETLAQDMPVPPKAAPKDQPPPTAPAAPATNKGRPEAPAIGSALQLAAQPSAPVITDQPAKKDAVKSEKPKAAPPPDEPPFAIDTPSPLPQPAAIALPMPANPPVERTPSDPKSSQADPASGGPVISQSTAPVLRAAIAVEDGKYDDPVEQRDVPNMPSNMTSPSTAPGADPAPASAPARDIAPAFAAALAPHTAPPESTPKPPIATITAQPGRIGQELGVAIAHHVASGTAATGGGETITLRLNPVDMGRIEVKLSFDDSGTLRAVVSADTPAALDMLRRDSADLGRALSDAGVRADTQTLRFDTRAGDGQRGQANDNGPPWQRQQDPRAAAMADTGPDTIEDITAYRPLRTRGGVDLVA
ncbi:flagellar hook-length control protein FliK [Sphingomonas aliaeris]|uniref:Flagellar hook-length control protein FliK n=1 Tax=Sphingomonas aliaeris TaxID=2759526 RepID=A0A974NTG4_9SPHN|nr:flagellar hook-length control protein FliK [Sphingomonas aliaeris]QQV76492.1 flagellar hook-length control protein FliK [Sphingomonas aliaeris]